MTMKLSRVMALVEGSGSNKANARLEQQTHQPFRTRMLNIQMAMPQTANSNDKKNKKKKTIEASILTEATRFRSLASTLSHS
jgi:hypothetical protein